MSTEVNWRFQLTQTSSTYQFLLESLVIRECCWNLQWATKVKQSVFISHLMIHGGL